MIPAAKAVYTVNPDIMIFFSGLDSDTNVSPLVSAQDLGGGYHFDVENFPFADKVVLELHDYSWDQLIPNCAAYDAALNGDGFYVLNMSAPGIQNRLPVVMTEFGFAPETYTSLYAQCLKQFLVSRQVGWTMWDISGSYYIRQGIQDYDEPWGKPAGSSHVSSKLNIFSGLLAKDWSGWRSKATIQNYYLPLIQASLNGKKPSVGSTLPSHPAHPTRPSNQPSTSALTSAPPLFLSILLFLAFPLWKFLFIN